MANNDPKLIIDVTQDLGLVKTNNVSQPRAATLSNSTPANTQYVSSPQQPTIKSTTINYTDPPLYGVPQLQIFNDPAGVTGQIQFNNANAFGADANLAWDNTNKVLRAKSIQVQSMTAGVVTGLVNIDVTQLHLAGGNNGYVLQTDGSGNLNWTEMTNSGNGTVGGANTQIQFNNQGNFAGDTGLTYNVNTQLLSAQNVTVNSGTIANLDSTDINAVTITATESVTTPSVITNEITVDGNVTANYFIGDGSELTNVVSDYANTAGEAYSVSGANVNGSVLNAVWAGTANSVRVENVSGLGNISTINLDNDSNNVLYGNGVFAPININGAYSNSNVVSLLTNFGTNSIHTTGNISANYFTGNGKFLTGIKGSNVEGQVSSANYAFYSNIADRVKSVPIGNVVGLGNVAQMNFNGDGDTVLTGAGDWVTPTNYMGYWSGNGNTIHSIYGGNIDNSDETHGATAGVRISENGNSNDTQLFNTYGNVVITAGLDAGNTKNYIFGSNGTATFPNLVTTTGNIQGQYFIGNGSQLTDINSSSIAGVVANAAYAVDANYASYAGEAFTVTGSNVSGEVANATYATSAGSSTTANTAGTVTTNAQPNITSVGTLSSVSVSGNTDVGNLNAQRIVTGNISANYFIGDGSQISNVDAITLNGYASNVLAEPSSLALRDANGNLTANYFDGVATGVAIGAVSNNFSYHMVFTTGAGDTTLHLDAGDNLQYNPDGGILTATRVDTNYLSVTDSVISNLIPFDNLAISLGNATNRWDGLYLDGDAVISANVSANYYTGNGSLLSSITGGNVTGTVANATYATSAGTAGTVTNNAQANITSVGTLESLSVSGNANVGNIFATNLGNVSELNLDGSSSNILYGNGVFASAPIGGGLPLANGNSNFNIATANGDVTVTADTSTWTFGTGGNLTTPSNLAIGVGSGGGSSILQYDQPLQVIGEGANSIVVMGWAANTNAPDQVAAIGFNSPYSNGASNVQIVTGNNATTVNYWNFDSTGNLTLPGGGTIYGNPYTPSGAPGNTITLQPAGSGTITDQRLLIYPTAADGDHIHITSGNLYQTELFLGSDNLYVKLANTGNVVVNSNDGFGSSAQWVFDTAGNLTIPGTINLAGGTGVIESSANIVSIYNEVGQNNGVVIWGDGLGNDGVDLQSNTMVSIFTDYSNAAHQTVFLQNGNIQTAGGIAPLTGNTFDIGNSSNYFRDAFFSGNVNGEVFRTSDGALTHSGTSVGINADAGKDVYLYADGSNVGWIFATTGNLEVPGNILYAGGASPAPYISGFSSITTINGGNIGGFLFDTSNLTLPGNTFSINYANGTQVPLGGGSYGDSNVVTLLESYGSNTITTTGNVSVGNIFATNLGNVSALNLDGNASHVLHGNGVFANIAVPSYIANINSNVAIATANGNVVTTVNASSILTVYSGGIKVGGSGVIQSPGGASSITLNNNGFSAPQANLTQALNVSGNANISGTASTGIGAINAGVYAAQLSNTVTSFTANVNSYTQVTLQNKSTGTDATADFILTADNGSDTTNYGDFGIINSGYDNGTPTNSLGNIVYAADTYLYAQGNTSNASQSGGNLVIGTTVPGKNVKIFAGGANNNSIIANISNTGISVTGNIIAIGNISGSTLYATNASGDEGGELQFTKPPNGTLSGGITVDAYVDKLRVFEQGGTARGMYFDIANSPAGVGAAVGYRDIPQVAASNTTLAATDAGKHYYSTSAGNFTLTIPNNATTSFNTGTAISIVMQGAGNILVNAASGVTLYMAGNSTSANRVVGTYGMATLMKVATDTWFINGTGVS